MTTIETMQRSFRWADEDDYGCLGEVMYDAVRHGESRYSERQRAAWVAAPRNGAEWTDRLKSQDVILAEASGEIIGFMSLAENGYIDFAYIRPKAQHSGLFRELWCRLSDKAKCRGEKQLWTHASLMAEPAFAAVGFQVTRRERVSLGGETFDRCEMQKPLAADEGDQ